MGGLANQVFQGGHNAALFHSRQAGLHRRVGAGAEKQGIVHAFQLMRLDIAPDFAIKPEMDARSFQNFLPQSHDFQLQLEIGDAKTKQAANFRVTVINGDADAISRKHISAGQARRPCTHYADAPGECFYMRKVGAPALLKCFVHDVALNGADGYRAKTGGQCAGLLTKSILRANPATDFRQAVGLMAQLGGFQDTAFLGQLEPVGNVIMDRAFPFAVGVAAIKAAFGLICCLLLVERLVDFTKFRLANFQRKNVRIQTGTFQEGKMIGFLCHVFMQYVG